jgi:tetratricopeptide (TPR) repeat protein
MRQGFAALKRHDLDGARTAFAAAWTERPHFAIAFSLAEVEMQLGLFRDAAEHWQFVLANLPADLADKRPYAREQLAECKKHVGTVTFRVKPDGATIYVEGKRLAEAPLNRELYLSPADHEVYAEKDGRRSALRTVRSVAGSKLSFELTVWTPAATRTPSSVPDSTVQPSAVPRVAPLAEPSSGSSLRTPILITGAALTLASAAFGTAYVLRSNAARDDATRALQEAEEVSDPSINRESACAIKERPPACDEATARLSDESHFRNVAIAGFLGTGVLAAATATTYWLWPGSGTTASSRRAVVVPTLVPRFAGVTVSGSF